MSWCINLFCVFCKRRWNKMIWFSCAWTWTGTWLWREIKRKKMWNYCFTRCKKEKCQSKGRVNLVLKDQTEWNSTNRRDFSLSSWHDLSNREREGERERGSVLFSLIWLGWGSICQRAGKKNCFCTSLSPDSVSVQGNSDGAFCYRRFICQGQNSFLPLFISNITLWSL